MIDRELQPGGPERLSAASYQDALQPDGVHLRDYLHVLSRRRWAFAIFFLSVVVVGAISTFMRKPVYTATVTIKIDKETPNILAFKEIYEVEKADEDYYQTQYKILKSRNIAARVIRKLNLDGNGGLDPGRGDPPDSKGVFGFFPFSARGSRTGSAEDVRAALLERFLSKVRVEPVPNSQLVNVSFTSHDPALARDAANGIAEAYIDYNVESKFDAGQQARNWLEQQLEIVKARLETSEEKLNRYCADNRLIYIEG
ncbi:MAG: Wzz/FepE/Etk N-terminal domain-containing protein, partial [Nitrospiraceae bacterium]|nr:Wzz/FepE/Etk N-terminal domain-containing protein [Nitrospiraceae bacterium]